MIRGERVLLRGISRDDLPLLWQYNNTLAVELAGGGDPPMPQSLERLQAEFDQQSSHGGRDGLSFAIEVNGRFIGQCALFGEDRVAGTCELGITIGDPDYWGQGYGQEAIQLLLDVAYQYHHFRKVWLRVHAANERAIRAYAACGFVEEGRLKEHVWRNGRYDDLVLMSHFHSA